MGNGDEPHAFGGTLRDARRFGFARAHSKGLLGRGPMLHHALTAHAHAAACRPAGVEAPRAVRVNARADGGTLILPREAVRASRAL
eukprot:6502657-Alexandrium_andersonii.AAC.1